MPYLAAAQKAAVDAGVPPIAAGELNYLLTRECLRYLKRNGLSYASLNDVVGALVAAKDEFTRRVVVPYEESKRKKNGEVYPSEYTNGEQPCVGI